MESNPQSYDVLEALQHWGAIVGVCLVFVLVLSVLVSLLVAKGRGPQRVGRQILDGFRDFADLSPRRNWALAMLTFREALRRKALAVFGVFAVLFMFAGWFLANANPRPELQVGVYITFVLTTIGWLILPVLLLLSCWSIPEDMRARSLHTVVTKPARRIEIVLGRMLGFGMLGTLLVLAMGAVSYVWIVRNFPAPAFDKVLAAADGTEYPVAARLTHRVNVRVTDPRSGETTRFEGPDDLHVVQEVAAAFPDIASALSGELAGLRATRPVLLSRVPQYGEIAFLDREGNPSARGVSVGDEWKKRSYVEGGSRSRAIWTFKDLDPRPLGDTLQFDAEFEAFRTHKGEEVTDPGGIQRFRGLLVQFTFLKDLQRQVSDAVASPGGRFESLRRHVREGDFRRAGTELRSLADGIQKRQLNLSDGEHDKLRAGYGRLAKLLEPFRPRPGSPGDRPDGAGAQADATEAWERLPELVEAARGAERAAAARDAAALAAALQRLGGLFESEEDRLQRELVDLRVPYPPFEMTEYSRRDHVVVPRRLPNLAGSRSGVGAQKAVVDLYDELTHGGELRVEVACLDAGQYLGVSQRDLYIRTPDRPFFSGFSKAVAVDWLKLMLVVIFGVTAGCFLKGPVAALLTFTLVLLGNFFHKFMGELVVGIRLPTGEIKRTGPVESAINIVTHSNPQVPLEEGWMKSIVDVIDPVLLKGVEGLLYLVPDLSRYSVADRVANGFDVSWSTGLLPALMTTLAYFIPLLLVGYYSLKLRELEAK
ncbi:MAG: hypothetical protein WD069_14565 [Planctomycetales bacterium]